MASPEADIVAHIEAQVTDLADKVFPHLRGEGTALPCAVYRVSRQPYPAMNGASTIARMQLDLEIIADTHAEARILADAVEAACDHATVSGIQSLHVDSQSSEAAIPDDGKGDAARSVNITLVAWTSTLAEV